MYDSGCYQITVSIESGVPEILKKIIKKPIDLKRSKDLCDKAIEIGIEVICNFVIGFPDETWEQIRTTIRYAENLNIDLINMHIATPLPRTRLMNVCLERGLLKEGELSSGYCSGAIETKEFSKNELQIVRAFEWDRINFSTSEKIDKIALIENLTVEEVQEWRKSTRRSLGQPQNID